MKKRNSIVIFFITIIVVSMSYNRFEWPQKDLNVKETEDYPKESSPPIPFIVGVSTGPSVIDPIDSWDDNSNNVISQVAETLFWYNITNLSIPIEPLLAESYSWDVTNTELTITVRDNVYFHDGTKLNASGVKWNMDRILYFTNATGALPPAQLKAYPSSIYYNTDGATPIINRTEVISEMVVKIILNQPFGAFLSLLSYTASSIISPTSHSATEYIDLTTGTLIGTGPFVFEGYEMDTEVNFHAFENYWNGKANITKLIFEVIEETSTRNNAMLNKDIHFLTRDDLDLLDQFIADPLITVVELGPDLIYWYLAFDCYRVNVTWREAISKAINYTYIIEEIRNGNAVRGPPCVPSNMPGHDPTVVVAQYDIPEARTIMQNMGFGVGWDIGTQVGDVFTPGADEALWLAATFFEDSNGHKIDLNYHAGSGFNRDLNDLIIYNLNFIGIEPVETTREWSVFLDDGEQGLLEGMWYVGWGLDYIDAFTYLDPLFNPASASNFINLTDPEIVGWLAAVAVETDIPTRDGIFSDLQHKLFEVLYAHTSLHASLSRDIHLVYLAEYPYNSLGSLYFYPCKWDPPSDLVPLTIFIDDANPLYNWEVTAADNDWCSGSGTWNDPYVIQDLELDGRSTKDCIEIYNSDVYFEIKNCTISSSSLNGITLTNVNNSMIFNNTFQLNPSAAIYSEFSNNNSIYDNFINASASGIYLLSSNINLLSNNIIQNTTYGISMNNCTKNIVSENYLYRNQAGIIDYFGFNNSLLENIAIENIGYGIALGFSVNITISMNDIIGSSIGGIILVNSNHSFIISNNISQNGDFGIQLSGFFGESINNTLSQNTIMNNNETGLGLDEFTKGNLIFNNEFINNSLNAQDNGTLNLWDNGALGNFWDDYVGVDFDDDGIGDMPYNIPGLTGSFDHYPIYDDGSETSPIITIITPSSHAFYSDIAPSFSISIDCPELDTSWYTIDNGITNITFIGSTGIIDQFEWDDKGNGTVTLTFYANDTIGRIGYSEVLVNKDIAPPVITIVSPEAGDIFGNNPPTYSIEINEANLDAIWYTLDDGAINITISELIGVIDADKWNDQPGGEVTIRFYAKDIVGNIGYSEVVVNKDIAPPVITIISPEVGDIFVTNSPLYSIEINEANLDAIWYTLDDGATNISISELIGVIDEAEWNSKPNGYVTIRFYANDTMGWEDTALVIVTKNTPPPEVPPGIPGANLLVIYLMLFIGIPILIWQREKKIKY